MKKQRLTACLLAAVLCLLQICCPMPDTVPIVYGITTEDAVASEDPVHSGSTIAEGSCGATGSEIEWFLWDNGTLSFLCLDREEEQGGMMQDWEFEKSPWFPYREQIKAVHIGDRMTSIGECAFYGCSNLTEVTIPDSVTSIGYAAFSGCSKLTEITIPDSVTSIESWAFADCEGLTAFTIPVNVTEICASVFHGCISLTEITIPDSVISIGAQAFYSCNALNSITIPDSVTSIGDYVFFGCSSLTEITIPDSVESIGRYTFTGCSRLTKITIPNSVTSIGMYAFRECSSLKSVAILDSECMIYDSSDTLPEDTVIYGYPNSTAQAYAEKYNQEFVVITAAGECGAEGSYIYWMLGQNGTMTISGRGEMDGREGEEGHAPSYLAYRDQISEIQIADGITKIGGIQFYGCGNLEEISIPDSVTAIGPHAFNNCTSLKTIALPPALMGIDDCVFGGCSALTEIVLPNSVTDIGTVAFTECSSLKSIVIPNPTCTIWDDSFTFPKNATIHGHPDSTAQAYAEKYKRTFVPLDVITTTPTTTTPTTTTPTTTSIPPKYKEEFDLKLGFMEHQVYKTESEIVDVKISTKNNVLCIIADTKDYLNLQAVQPGTCDIEVYLANGDVYVIHLTVGSGIETQVATTSITTATTTPTTTTVTTTPTTTTATTTSTTTTVTTTPTTTTATTTSTTTTTTTSTTTTTTTSTTIAATTSTTAIGTNVLTSTTAFVKAHDTWNFQNSTILCEDTKTGNLFLREADKNRIRELFDDITWNAEHGPQKMLSSKGVAVCYGMTLLSYMNLCGVLNPSDIDGMADVLHDLKIEDEAVKSAIVFHNLMQMLPDAANLRKSYIAENLTDGEKLTRLLEILKSGNPAFVGYYKKNHDQHTVLAYGYYMRNADNEKLFQALDPSGKYNCMIQVYDPNNPSCPAGMNILFHTETLKWHTGGNGEMGSDIPNTHINYVLDETDILTAGSPYCNEHTADKEIRYYPNLYMDGMPDAPVPVRVRRFDGIWQEAGDDLSVIEDAAYISGDAKTNTRNFVMRYDTESYLFHYEDDVTDTVDLEMVYQNVLYNFKSNQAHSVLFSPDGMEIEADAVSYTLRIVQNRTANTRDFYMLGITGNRGGNMHLTKSDNSWILRAEKPLAKLTVSAVNAQDSEIKTDFRTSAKEICFYAKSSDEIGMRFDTDCDGTFETELADEDVNYDGTVSVADAVAAVRFATEANGGSVYIRDVNKDGLYTVLDAVQVLRVIQRKK